MTSKKIGMVLGIILIVLGLLGLAGGLGLGLVGADGVFVTNLAHSLVHLVAGAVLLIVAMKSASSLGMAFKVLGIVLVLAAVIGFVMGSPILGFLASNMMSNVLNLVVGAILIWAGFMGVRRTSGSMEGGNMNTMA